MTAAMHAASCGHVEALEWLMKACVDIFVVDNNDCTILHHACTRGRIQCVKTVLCVPQFYRFDMFNMCDTKQVSE